MTEVSIVVINKNEDGIRDTVRGLLAHDSDYQPEIVVVDASSGRYQGLRESHPGLTWVDFEPVPGIVTIPHQRNTGVRQASGAVIVFVDSSCEPEPGWLNRLLAPIVAGEEELCAGGTRGRGEGSLYAEPSAEEYLSECPTINVAFTRALFERVGGFDESFAYGSDVDFSWRVRRAGGRIRNVPQALVIHDWGDRRRQLKRAFRYGEARARLYANHPWQLRHGPRQDPIVFAYPLFLLLLPLALLRPLRWIPLLAVVPLVRNRGKRPFLTLADHLCYGAGALAFVAGRVVRIDRRR